MNASLCRLPGGPGLPSHSCRGCVRGERLHSVYIIKARRTHRGLQIQSLPRSGLVSVFLSLSLTLTDMVTHSLIHHSLVVSLAKPVLSLCSVHNTIITACDEEFRESACSAALSVWLCPIHFGKPVSTFWVWILDI